MEGVIPKIAHFMWLGTVMPKWGQDNVEHFKALHPDWEVKVWSQYPPNVPDYLDKLLRRVDSAKTRVELLRIWILHQHGGVYMDTDLRVMRPIDSLLAKPFTALTHHNRAVSPCIIGAPAAHESLEWLLGVIRFSTNDINRRDYFGTVLFTAMRRDHPELLRFLPEHYFCIFRVGVMAARFLGLTAEEQEYELAGMWNRMPDGERPFAIHTWGVAPKEKLKEGEVVKPVPSPLAPPVTRQEVFEEVSFGTKLKNVTRAAARVGKHVLRGQKVLVSDEEFDRRIAICKGDPATNMPACRFFKAGSCQKCGCVSAFKNRLATEHCPIGLW